MGGLLDVHRNLSVRAGHTHTNPTKCKKQIRLIGFHTDRALELKNLAGRTVGVRVFRKPMSVIDDFIDDLLGGFLNILILRIPFHCEFNGGGIGIRGYNYAWRFFRILDSAEHDKRSFGIGIGQIADCDLGLHL